MKLEDNDHYKPIQFKLGELINNISRFDNEQTGKLTRARYESFMSTNNELVNEIEGLLKMYGIILFSLCQ